MHASAASSQKVSFSIIAIQRPFSPGQHIGHAVTILPLWQHPPIVVSASECATSEHTPFGERYAAAVADDDVIQQPDIDQRQRVLDSLEGV
jgi:hypothetical protein